jgi:signal transduction histidine kinase
MPSGCGFARELHDVVAHSMAMINVQATAASIQLADDPGSAAEALQAIRGASKAGLRAIDGAAPRLNG